MKRRFLVFLLVIMLLPQPIIAQDEQPECDVATIATEFSERLAEATDLETLLTIQTELSDALAPCQGLSFTGTSGEVIGPIEVPAGIYILKIENAAVEFQTIDGDCDEPFMSTGIGDNEAIFNSEGCLTLADIELREGDEWSLQFELVRAGG